MTPVAEELDELCFLSSQSLSSLVTSEHFKMVKKLGEGSYGKVMLALHKKRGTPMALKFFPKKSTSLFNFLREYNLSLSYCTHPSLTRALGIFYSTPTYYVFAQQAGLYGDLYNVIVNGDGMEDHRAQRVMSQLSGAVSHLHSLGFVHRDIKPENIFLCDPRCRWVKLGDFGLTRSIGTEVRGVWYDSPFCTPEVEASKEIQRKWDNRQKAKENNEQEEEEEEEDLWITIQPSIDSWSLGVLVYCLLTGCFPWGETTLDDFRYKRYKAWFDREVDREREAREDEEKRRRFGGDETDDLVIAEDKPTLLREPEKPPSQFEGLSTLVMTLIRELLHPEPKLRGSPEDILSYLGGPWTTATEEQERRKAEEAEKEARQIREAGGVEKELVREGRGER